MRIIIAGSRTATEQQVLEALRRCHWIGFAAAVVSGTAKGADLCGEVWAEANGLAIHQFPADWEKHGKRAGPVRNKLMAENAEGLVAVWDGESRGTRSMIELARNRGLRITVLRTDTGQTLEFPATGIPAHVWEETEERAAMKEYAGDLSRQRAEREAGFETYERQLTMSNAVSQARSSEKRDTQGKPASGELVTG